jgi:nitric oxide synthase oxygenase domain/subunit
MNPKSIQLLQLLKEQPYTDIQLMEILLVGTKKYVMRLISDLRKMGHNIQLRPIDHKYEYTATVKGVVIGKKLGYHNSKRCVRCAQWREFDRVWCPDCGSRLRTKSRRRDKGEVHRH